MNMLLIYILTLSFQPLLLDSRTMILCNMMCHVTTVIGLFIIQEKEKEKKEMLNQEK